MSSHTITQPVARHAELYRIARALYTLPGATTAARNGSRLAIQLLPLPLKRRQQIYNFFASNTVPSHPIYCHTTTPTGRRLQLELDLSDDLSRRWYYWGYTGGYEPEVLKLLMRLVPTRRYVFDVGANIGYYSLLLGSILQGRGAVYAFEPWPEVFGWLAHNVALNEPVAVHPFLLALADRDGEGDLLLPADRAYSNASLVPGFIAQSQRLAVTIRRLDSFCREQGVTRIDLLKLDVEGAELAVLHGMGELLLRWRPDIICEVLPPFADDLDRFFRNTPYRKFHITSTGLREMPQLVAHEDFRDYYLSCAPSAAVLGSWR